MIALFFGMSHYNKLVKRDSSGKWVDKSLPNLNSKAECDKFRKCMKSFGFTSKEDIYDLSDNPTVVET